MQPDADPDVFVVREAFSAYFQEQLTGQYHGRALDDLRNNGAVERLLKKERDALAKDGSDIYALMRYFNVLQDFLFMEFPHKRDLYWEPLKFTVSVLDVRRAKAALSSG